MLYERYLEMRDTLSTLRGLLDQKKAIAHPTQSDLAVVQEIERQAREIEIAANHLRKAMGMAA